MGKVTAAEWGSRFCWCRDCEHRSGLECRNRLSPNFEHNVPPLGSCDYCQKASDKDIRRRGKEGR